MPEATPVSITLTHLEERAFTVRALPDGVTEVGTLAVQLDVNARYEREPELLHLTFGVALRPVSDFPEVAAATLKSGQRLGKPTAEPLISLTALFVFRLAGATAQFDPDLAATAAAWPRFPPDLRTALVSTAYATCRGLLFGHLSGTPYRHLLLPLIDPASIGNLATGGQ